MRFTQKSDKIIATDPCYTKDDNSIIISNVLPGDWEVYTFFNNEGQVSELMIQNSKFTRIGFWEFVSDDALVDSGQFGFFDLSVYPEGDTGEYDDKDSFYSIACNATENEEFVIEGGAVSSSGYGDGSYRVELSKIHDKVVAIRVIFIDENEDDYYIWEEEHENDDWYDNDE